MTSVRHTVNLAAAGGKSPSVKISTTASDPLKRVAGVLRQDDAAQAPDETLEPRARHGKIDVLVALLCQPTGVSLAEMMAATGWQAHSVRGAMAGTIKKKRQLTIVSEKSGEIRMWRIAGDCA